MTMLCHVGGARLKLTVVLAQGVEPNLGIKRRFTYLAMKRPDVSRRCHTNSPVWRVCATERPGVPQTAPGRQSNKLSRER